MPLTEAEIHEYLSKHLPYRINMMLAQALMEHRIATHHPYKAAYQEGLTNAAAFELSTMMGRKLLEFLGVKWDKKNNCLTHPGNRRYDGDVDIKSLFPERGYYPLNDEWVIGHEAILIQLIKVGHKNAAHFTDHILVSYDQEQIPMACLIVYQMLFRHIPELEPYKESIWWYRQVEQVAKS